MSSPSVFRIGSVIFTNHDNRMSLSRAIVNDEIIPVSINSEYIGLLDSERNL